MSISKKDKGQINAVYMFRIKWLKNLFPSTVYLREKKLPVYMLLNHRTQLLNNTVKQNKKNCSVVTVWSFIYSMVL